MSKTPAQRRSAMILSQTTVDGRHALPHSPPPRSQARGKSQKKGTGPIFGIVLAVFINVFWKNELLRLKHQPLQFDSRELVFLINISVNTVRAIFNIYAEHSWWDSCLTGTNCAVHTRWRQRGSKKGTMTSARRQCSGSLLPSSGK